jgi:hypothetical protein
MALIITSEEELNKLAPPALPQATNQYSRQYQDQLNNVLRLYFNRITALQQQLSWAQPVDYIDFNTTGAVAPHQIGRLQQIGQETYARVQNDTGVTIPNGTVVGFAGATDDAIKVSPYIADGSQSSLYIVGVMTHDFPDTGSRGYCTVWGFVRDVNTSAFSQGDILYASTTVAGALTNIKPTAPNNVVVVAAAIKIGTTDGIIFVRPTITQQQYYGTFNRGTDFIPALANTAYALPFTSSTLSSGVFIGTPASRIVVGQSGLYNISCTLQYSSSNAAQKNVYSWVRTNGVDIPESARISTLNLNGGYRTVLTSETASLAANDYVEIMVAVSDVAYYTSAVITYCFIC